MLSSGGPKSVMGCEKTRPRSVVQRSRKIRTSRAATTITQALPPSTQPVPQDGSDMFQIWHSPHA
eukprot:13370993-Heterocapsa_arctica.AAC.1